MLTTTRKGSGMLRRGWRSVTALPGCSAAAMRTPVVGPCWLITTSQSPARPAHMRVPARHVHVPEKNAHFGRTQSVDTEQRSEELLSADGLRI